MFKKFLPKTAIFYIINLGLVNLALAQQRQRVSLPNPLGEGTQTFRDVVVKLAQAITYIGIPIAGIFIIYSGFLFVSARGNEEQITKAKSTFFWTMVGTLLIVGAWAIATALSQFAEGLGRP